MREILTGHSRSRAAVVPASQAPRRLRRAALVLAVAGGVLAVLAVRLVVEAGGELAAGAEAGARGDRRAAIRHIGRAASLYVPGAPHVPRALDGLGALASQARAAGDQAAERAALEATRAALLGARSFFVPQAERLAAANRRLAEIYAAIDTPRAALPNPSALRPRAAAHLANLERVPGAGLGASALALFGFALWLGAAVLFFRRGVDAGVKPRPGWALAAGVGFVLGVALFLLGLRAA